MDDAGYSRTGDSFSKPGEDWKRYYQDGTLSWCDPKKVTVQSIEKLYHSEWLQRMLLHINKGKICVDTILEAGCGTGVYGLSLAYHGFRVDAFDYSSEALKIVHLLEDRVRSSGINLTFSAREDNLTSIQSPDNTYDLCFNQAVLEYFTDTEMRRHVISEMKRVVRSGGSVAAILQHTGHPFSRIWKKLGWQGYTNQPDVAEVTPKSLYEDFIACGLENVVIDGILPFNAFFYYPRWYMRWDITHNAVYRLGKLSEKFVRLPLCLRRKLAVQIVAVGRKL